MITSLDRLLLSYIERPDLSISPSHLKRYVLLCFRSHSMIMHHDSNHSTTMMIKSMMLILSINPQLAREIWFGKEFSCIITFVIILYHFLSPLAAVRYLPREIQLSSSDKVTHIQVYSDRSMMVMMMMVRKMQYAPYHSDQSAIMIILIPPHQVVPLMVVPMVLIILMMVSTTMLRMMMLPMMTILLMIVPSTMLTTMII
mmetsp:Transcript_9410/g.9174  ORF Transcript_9410/g.9174 Transcript_9410/m.9174 type:complete len:200 (-) Transcript_9410:70-669(-)